MPEPDVTPDPSPHGPPDGAGGVSRRSFLRSAGLSAAAAAAASPAVARHAMPGTEGSDAAAADAAISATRIGPEPSAVRMMVNGAELRPSVEPATTLLETLRHECDLTGSKQVCDRASCGGCSVLVDGDLVASCMMLAHDADGRTVTTIEGLRQADGSLHPLQEAFVRHDALQCGYCTPGFVMAAKSLLDRVPKPTLDEIKQGLAGNICRCGTYTNIFNAVLDASGQPLLTDGEL
ncbi:MAG: (2Fe-2S)-binding protein [Phycisphaerales bacterium]